MKPYAEFLAEQGATPEDIKLLDTPVAQKAYKAAHDRIEAAEASARTAQEKVTGYDKWYNEQAIPAAAKLQSERDTAVANAAAESARVKALQDAGLLEVAKERDQAPVKPAADSFDPSKHNLVTRDFLATVAEKEGDAIALMQDIADEHRDLFGTRINAKELRVKAKEQNKSLEQVWMETYNVPAKRAERTASDKAAYEKKIADEAVAKYRSESINPNTGAPMPSSFSFLRKPADGTTGDPKAPWNTGDRSNDRVNKALQTLTKTAPFSGPVN